MARLAILCAGLALAGCGSTPSAVSLGESASLANSDWVALDLASGAVTPVTGTVDPADAQWRGPRILFRQVAAGSALVGRAVADVVAEADEHPPRRTAHDRLWIAALELTQAQWLAMGGGRPWLAVLPVVDQSPWTGDAMPAFGLSPAAVETVFAAWSRDGWQLDLPEAHEWERACLAGSTAKFAWGDDLDADAAAAWAVCDAGTDMPHPQPVGGRRGNAWGLFDMHGNVWELVRDGLAWQARGGAWDQPVVTARASNRLEIRRAGTVGWSVGVRPVLRR